MKLIYGNIYTRVTEVDTRDIAFLRTVLTFSELEEKLYVNGLSLFERDNKFLSGLAPLVISKLESANLPYELEGFPALPDSLPDVGPDLLHGVTLHQYQVSIANKALYRKRGLVVSPTGSGKTIVSAAIAKWISDHIGGNTLMVVPGLNSLNQMADRWEDYGLGPIGRLGGGQHTIKQRHVIAVVNSLYQLSQKRSPEFLHFLKQVNCIMWMEVQHLGARTWVDSGKLCDAEYRIGLSATPFSGSKGPVFKSDYAIVGMTGDPVVTLSDAMLMDMGYMATPRVHLLKASSSGIGAERNWLTVKRYGINHNASRNQKIIDVSSGLAKKGRKVITLVSEISHGKELARAISLEIGVVYMFHGGSILHTYLSGKLQQTERTPIYTLAKRLADDDSYVLIGSPAVDEDADFPDANVMILAGAGRAYRRVIQRIGRVLRPKEGENVVDIVDFSDRGSYVLQAQSAVRKRYMIERFGAAKNFKVIYHDESDQVINAIS